MPHSGGHSLKWPTSGRQYNPCRLGGPQRFRAGDKISTAPQVGRLSTQPLPLGGSPPLWSKGHSQQWPTSGWIGSIIPAVWGPQRLRAGDKTRKGLQVGTLPT